MLIKLGLNTIMLPLYIFPHSSSYFFQNSQNQRCKPYSTKVNTYSSIKTPLGRMGHVNLSTVNLRAFFRKNHPDESSQLLHYTGYNQSMFQHLLISRCMLHYSQTVNRLNHLHSLLHSLPNFSRFVIRSILTVSACKQQKRLKYVKPK